MRHERSILVGLLCACASLTALAYRFAPAAAETRACVEFATPAAAELSGRSTVIAEPPRALSSAEPIPPAIVATVELPPSAPAAAAIEPNQPARAPELAGLQLDPRASDERLRDWYARATDEDLVRARFRLERLLELARVSEGALARLLAGDVDVRVVERELAHVADRLMHWPASTSVLAEVATRPHDDGAVFAERYARRSAEDLAIAAWRVSRALEFAQTDAISLAFACGDYAVVTASAGWG